MHTPFAKNAHPPKKVHTPDDVSLNRIAIISQNYKKADFEKTAA